MKKVIWSLAAMFIGGIFFWYGFGKASNTVAQVNKTKIDVIEFNKRVSQQLRRYREQAEQDLTEDQIFELRRQVLSSIITQEILYEQSKELGVFVSDEEIINTIHNLPQFQNEGKFNFNLYIQALRYSLNTEPEEFETLIKKNIANRKLERLILSSAKVTEPELTLKYLTENGNTADFQDHKEELRGDLLQTKRTAIYRNWMNSLQKKSKIKVNQKLAGLVK